MTEAKRFPRGCVASPHYLASSAGLAVLASGGNALDAAIATNLTLGAVSPYMCGYGGDLFAMIWDGKLHGYNGSGRSPAAATPDAVRSVIGSDVIGNHGPFTVTVPGAVEGWFTLLDRFGTRSFADLAQPALRYARDGFIPTTNIARAFAGLAKVFADDWGAPWRDIYAGVGPGEVLRQPALARTIETLCEQGAEPYYRGAIAAAMAETLQRHGALMTTDDLGQHTGDWVDPISTTYNGLQIFQLPPNSQGIVTLEALNILEGVDLGEAETAERHHVLIEAAKLAYADRNAYVTDIDHMQIDPSTLASKDWGAKRREQLDLQRASSPAVGKAAVGGTIYLCAADEDGMCVSLIQSNYAGFGSGVTVGDWGINLQNRGAFFSLDPAHANVIAPRKRTLHTLMPAMAMRDGRPAIVFGTMGGDAQAQIHLQFLNRVLHDGADIQDAIDTPRWSVSSEDWKVTAESDLSEEIIAGLRERGHDVAVSTGKNGHAHAIQVTDDGYAAAYDPRSDGAALGL